MRRRARDPITFPGESNATRLTHVVTAMSPISPDSTTTGDDDYSNTTLIPSLHNYSTTATTLQHHKYTPTTPEDERPALLVAVGVSVVTPTIKYTSASTGVTTTVRLQYEYHTSTTTAILQNCNTTTTTSLITTGLVRLLLLLPLM